MRHRRHGIFFLERVYSWLDLCDTHIADFQLVRGQGGAPLTVFALLNLKRNIKTIEIIAHCFLKQRPVVFTPSNFFQRCLRPSFRCPTERDHGQIGLSILDHILPYAAVDAMPHAVLCFLFTFLFSVRGFLSAFFNLNQDIFIQFITSGKYENGITKLRGSYGLI